MNQIQQNNIKIQHQQLNKQSKINWASVHLNRNLVNEMIKQAQKNQKYCTLNNEYFLPKSEQLQSQKQLKKKQEFYSPQKVNKNRMSLTNLTQRSEINSSSQQYLPKKQFQFEFDAIQNQNQSSINANLIQQELENKDQISTNNAGSVTEQANINQQFSRLFKINKTFVEQQNEGFKKINGNSSSQAIIKQQDSNKDSHQDILCLSSSPLKTNRSRNHKKLTFDQPSLVQISEKIKQSTIKNNQSTQQLLQQSQQLTFSPSKTGMETQKKNLKQNIEDCSIAYQSLPILPQCQPADSKSKNQTFNLHLQNKNQYFNKQLESESTKNHSILKNLDSARSSQQTHFNNKPIQTLRTSRQNSCINVLDKVQKHQMPQSLNIIGNSFDESLNVTDLNANDPHRINSLQNIDFLLDKTKSNTNNSDYQIQTFKASPQKQQKKIFFHQSSLNYLDDYVSQSKLYRESMNNKEESNSVTCGQTYTSVNRSRKAPTQSMKNIINRCFLSSNKYPLIKVEDLNGQKDSSFTNNYKDQQFKSSLNLKMESLSNLPNQNMTRYVQKQDFYYPQIKSSPILSPLTERQNRQNDSRISSRFLLKQKTRKESSISSSNAISGKTTKPQSIINSPPTHSKDSSANIPIIDACFGGVNQLDAFLERLQSSYQEIQKQNKFQFIQNMYVRFNDSPLKEFIYLTSGAPLREDIEDIKLSIKQQFKVIGINYWKFKEIQKLLFDFMEKEKTIFENDKKNFISQFQNLEEQIFQWRIYDELERYTIQDIIIIIKEELEQDQVSQQVLQHFSFMQNNDQFEKLLALAFTTKTFSQYEQFIKEEFSNLNWTYADIMCAKLSIYKIFTKNFKFSKLSMANFFDFIERMRYIATKKPDFFIRLQEKDNDYQNFFSTVNRQCLQYLLVLHSQKDSSQVQSGYIVNQQFFFSQQAQNQALQSNVQIEMYLMKFIQNLFFGSLDTSLFDIVKNEKYEKVISQTTFTQIRQIILNQLDFYVCPPDYLLEIKKKLRLIKIQLGLKISFNEQLLESFQQSSNPQLKNLPLNKTLQYLYQSVIKACSLNQTLLNQNILGKEENMKIFAITIINFIFDVIVDKNFPTFVSIYDCLAYSKVFGIPSFYYEEIGYILKSVITQIIGNQNYSQKFIQKIEKQMSVLIKLVQQFD
ncbi:hypothetical protein TTHERM_01080540 (macronuclear) [Tetrahymena thermophila SB210]|uniref:Uncharacterized protein n=1 Tax=Tetrahymena thermophila (strain SB210) TaxID=312017 RepID=Q22C16_TETTS|nr:hypothetical protein TTHERM_01080540 [Tetrahymena thermophila SB210]EAR82846.2 hypothetical protein TTHERM_01080540 [Tetrahymena thermophila SB210]|eukprot:XP_001030509.2 hypothetical protein TTHERM_01080540 [Tetrahymena thermophila SB210]